MTISNRAVATESVNQYVRPLAHETKLLQTS